MFERIGKFVDAVPEFDRFAGVDELVAAMGEIARQHQGLAEMRRIGTSRDGEPLWSLTIHGGEEQMLVVGGGASQRADRRGVGAAPGSNSRRG